MQKVENYLKVLLQAFGAVTAIALVPFVMPRSWMTVVHEWLGMGVLPDKPVVEYLARTTLALYGFLGGLYLVLARDVRRFARVITYSAVATLLISAVNTALCLAAGMPTWWMSSDAVACWLFGLGILFLQRRAAEEEHRACELRPLVGDHGAASPILRHAVEPPQPGPGRTLEMAPVIARTPARWVV